MPTPPVRRHPTPDTTGQERGLRPVVVHPPLGGGSRSLTVHDQQAGTVRSLEDIVEILYWIGVSLDPEEARTTPLIEWRGGGPDAWWDS